MIHDPILVKVHHIMCGEKEATRNETILGKITMGNEDFNIKQFFFSISVNIADKFEMGDYISMSKMNTDTCRILKNDDKPPNLTFNYGFCCY